MMENFTCWNGEKMKKKRRKKIFEIAIIYKVLSKQYIVLTHIFIINKATYE